METPLHSRFRSRSRRRTRSRTRDRRKTLILGGVLAVLAVTGWVYIREAVRSGDIQVAAPRTGVAETPPADTEEARKRESLRKARRR